MALEKKSPSHCIDPETQFVLVWGVVRQVMTQPREENEETVHEDWMSYVINTQRRHGSFSLSFQRSELLPLKNSSPVAGSNRRYLHKDPCLQHLPFTRPLFPPGNLLLLLLMMMLQRIKHLAATSHHGAAQYQTKRKTSETDSWRKPCHHSHNVKCGVTPLCVFPLYLRTPLPVWVKLMKENRVLAAQRISCTVEKTVEIFGLGL